MTFDSQMFERMACSLETIADALAVRETRYCHLLAVEKFAYVRGDEVVGAFWRLTFLNSDDAHTFELDLCVKHPDEPALVARGDILLRQLGKAVGTHDGKGRTEDLVGLHFALQFVGTQVVGIYRDDVAKRIEARKLPPPDVIDFEAASLDFVQSRLEAEGIEIDPRSLD